MTLQDIGQYCEAYQEQQEENLKQIAYVQYRVADKLVSGLNMGKPKHVGFKELFPDFFKENYNIPQTEEERILQERATWLNFLGLSGGEV